VLSSRVESNKVQGNRAEQDQLITRGRQTSLPHEVVYRDNNNEDDARAKEIGDEYVHSKIDQEISN